MISLSGTSLLTIKDYNHAMTLNISLPKNALADAQKPI